MSRKLYLNKWNYLIFLLGAVILTLGYFLMTIGPYDSVWSLTVAPILIIFSLTVVFPIGIMKNFKKDK